MFENVPFLNLAGNLGALGVVFWLVWKTVNHTIPGILATFERSLTETRTDFRETLGEQRKDFEKILEDHREFFAGQTTLNCEQTKELVQALKEFRVGGGAH